MGVGAWAVYGLSSRFFADIDVSYGANALCTMLGIGAGVVIYAVLVVALRILRAEDVRALPRGEKLAKVLHLK